MLLSEGQMSDYKGAALMLPAMPKAKQLLADKGYDADWFHVDLPRKFHPAAIRASADFTSLGAGGATCDRRSWSGLRRRSHVAERLAA